MRLVVLGTIGAAILASGCATVAPATCDPPQFDPPGRLTCEVVVAAAREQLAAVAGVTRLEVLWRGCPPNATCFGHSGNSAGVIATIAEGRQVFVWVVINQAGGVQADPPQPVVPSQLPAGG